MLTIIREDGKFLKVGTGVGANIPEGDEYDWL